MLTPDLLGALALAVLMLGGSGVVTSVLWIGSRAWWQVWCLLGVSLGTWCLGLVIVYAAGFVAVVR